MYKYKYKQIILHILLLLYKKSPISHEEIEQIDLFWNIQQFLNEIMRMKDVRDSPIGLALGAINNLEVFRLPVNVGVPQLVNPPYLHGHFSQYDTIM